MVDNCHDFIMSGNGSAGHSDDGLPQPTSRIYCDKTSNAGLFFSNSTNISIKNLELRFCSGEYNQSGWYHISASLVFHSVQNISLDQVFVSDIKGFGLYAKDIFDSVCVVDSAFLNSSKHQNFSHNGNAGFNLSAQYSFTSLVLDSSWFMYGVATQDIDYAAAGGLTIAINSPNTHVKIVNVTTRGNTGGLGGNIALFLILFNANSSSVVINNSHIADGHALKGGGLAFWSKQSRESAEYYYSEKDNDILTICDTNFHSNKAILSSGAMYKAHYNDDAVSHLKQVIITNCTFTKNYGIKSSVDIVQHSLQPMTPFLNTSLVLCDFINNRLSSDDGAVVMIYSDSASLISCTFIGSTSTAVSLSNAYLHLRGDILFENNKAKVGGAMKVNEASLIFIHSYTHVQFINNRAEEKGGAIYVKTSCKDTSESTLFCFLQPAPMHDMPVVSEFTKLMTLEFVNNSAKVLGDALYGGDFDQCSTTLPYYLNEFQRYENYSYSREIFNGTFDMKQQHGSSKISSDPHKACFCNKLQSETACKVTREPITVYPGQEFTVSAITVGQMDTSTRGRINASLVNETYPSHRLHKIGNADLTDKCANITYILKSNRSHAQVILAPETAGIYCNTTTASLIVRLLPCPLGFQLTRTAPYVCSCDPLLSKFLMLDLYISCCINNQTISVPQKTIWFGCFDSGLQNQSSLTCDSLAVVQNCDPYCHYAKCKSTTVEVPLLDLDKQCSEGHTGIMCGTCKPGYSRVLGDLIKCQKGCMYTNLPIILMAFFGSGILLLVIIRFLNLTVTEGTINGLLVYTMVMQTHHGYFSENPSAFAQVCWVFISWINLTLGIKACFYRGMTGYEQIWILFGQAFFSFLFLFIIILLGQKFILFTKLLGRNIVKVLATLVAMMYSNLLFAIFITFHSTTMHISMTNGTQYSKTVWYYDGSIPYLGLKHAPLFVTALICSLFILYLSSSLLFIQCLQKRSELPCLRWVERLRPSYEAYTGPCRDHYRFWPGFLFFVRTGLFIMNSLIPSHIDVFFRFKMLISAVVFVLIISLACISPQGVYKKWPINILEFSFYLNLCITSGFLGLNYSKHKNISAVYTSVSIAALTFFGILVYHCYSQVKNTEVWKRLTIWISVRARFVRNHAKPDGDESEECNERDPLLPQALPPVIRFDHLREPLVEA